MTGPASKSRPTWKDVKAKLAGFDHAGLLSLVGDLYTGHKDNQPFLHARLGLIEDVLKSYKETKGDYRSVALARRWEESKRVRRQNQAGYFGIQEGDQ